ncbi:MAG: DUF5683 domain-containing protein [Bacteroides sp.]|nr:DUF5683 domain-containing protein [Bacteroides sp.]
MINNLRTDRILILVLCLFLQTAGISGYAQRRQRNDSIAPPKASLKRGQQKAAQENSTLVLDSLITRGDSDEVIVDPDLSIAIVNDTIVALADSVSLVADSIAGVNQEGLAQLEEPLTIDENSGIIYDTDSVFTEPALQEGWKPKSDKSVWLSVVVPGGGQIYNRKYWKLPIIYGGFVGCTYALTWNNQMYKDYAQAYRDIMDDDPTTNSYEDFFPPGYDIGTDLTRWQTTFKNRKDMYRRYRDLSIFAFIGVYLISVIDAYVDAELSSFDISPDLSFRVSPGIMHDPIAGRTLGLQCNIIF